MNTRCGICSNPKIIYRGLFVCLGCDSAHRDGELISGPVKTWPWHRVNYCKHQPACGPTMRKLEK